MTLAHGIDVHPRYQPIRDWAKVARSVHFVIVKLTEGRAFEPVRFDGAEHGGRLYFASARSADALAGTYHLCHPGHNSPTVEADFYVRVLEAIGWTSGLDLPPVLDVEPSAVLQENVQGQQLVDWCVAFMARVDAAFGLTSWHRCGLYVGASIFGYFDWRSILDKRGTWFWHGGYGATAWPTSMPSTPAAIYQRVAPVSLVPGVEGSSLDIDVVRPEDLRSLAPLYFGEDMPLTDADIAKIKAMPISNTVTDEPGDTVALGAVLARDRKRLYDTKAAVDTVAGDVTAIKAKVETMSTGGVDLDLLATKVADLLALRLQS